MGSWFSNIHIRKNETATEETIEKYIGKIMASKHYLPCTSEIDADGAIAIVASEDCRWISIYSDLLSLEEPSKCAEIMVPLSSELHTDVLGISCFDSDYLYLNLINTSDKTDAWIGIGSASGLGIKRRSGISAWKKKVSDFQAFSESVKKKYVFAEEFLAAVERCLELPTVQSSASYEYLKDFELDKKARYFYFKLPEDMKPKEPVKLVPHMYSGMPCFLDKPSVVDGINVGGESRGVSVYFIGPYVENDEIIATLMMSYQPGNAGLHEVATLKECRGRGACKALLNRAFIDAREMGYELMSLQASPLGEPVYRSIGMRVVSHIRTYQLAE